jgi:protein subunit release factor A
MKYKSDDGWDLNEITPLGEFMRAYNNMQNEIYELKSCVRTKSLEEMRDKLLMNVERMQEALEKLEDDDEVEE